MSRGSRRVTFEQPETSRFIGECGCYACWPIADPDHRLIRHSLAAVMDNAESDRQLHAMGLPSRTVECDENPGCWITVRQGQWHAGVCLMDGSLGDDLMRIAAGEEHVAWLR